MQGIKLNFKGMEPFVSHEELLDMSSRIYEAHDKLMNKTGKGKEMLGWMDLPYDTSEELVKKIYTAADKIKKQADVFIVIGIGGSYLGAKAMIDLFTNSFSNMISRNDRKFPEIIFAGNTLSGKYLRDLVEYVSDKDIAINVISKSGTTLEPAISFRILRLLMEEKYGVSGAAERIYVTTDGEKGILKNIADENSYETFEIPRNVGGRYSVLTPVGLLPMAVAGIDLQELLDGALFASHLYNEKNIETNDCYKYVAYRNILREKGKDIEILSSFEPSFMYFVEWFKQLFGESESKDGVGIFPAGTTYTTDLHSMGQLVQDGKRNLTETMINVEVDRSFIKLPETEKNDDNLNYLAGKEIDYINKQAFLGTVEAHINGEVPVTIINIQDLTEYNIGELIYFFEKSCAMSGYVLGVNPFDQPGVEAYKKNMMNLLKNDEI